MKQSKGVKIGNPYNVNTQVRSRSRKRCCRGKAVSITCSERLPR